MRHNPLGRTGVLVSELCLGTMTFGEGWGFGGIDVPKADEILGKALDAGINFVDTADLYSAGDSEKILGEVLGDGRRDRIVLATKAYGRMGPGPNDVGLSRYHLVRACEASLRRLKTDRIDLYQIHGYDAPTPIEEVVRALDDLAKAGKILYAGFCNLAAWQAALALGIADAGGHARFVSAQMYYSLVGRDVEHEVVPLCLHEGLALLPWSPLAGGFLSGKYRREQEGHPEGSRFATSRFGWFPPLDQELGFRTVDLLTELASRHGTTPATLAIKWLLTRPAVASVIIGLRRIDQLDALLEATRLEIPAEELTSLDELTAPPAQYPGWMIRRQANQRVAGY
jgi:aryl-alcohol dehydrogenase-like predicted oxidoreductase